MQSPGALNTLNAHLFLQTSLISWAVLIGRRLSACRSLCDQITPTSGHLLLKVNCAIEADISRMIPHTFTGIQMGHFWKPGKSSLNYTCHTPKSRYISGNTLLQHLNCGLSHSISLENTWHKYHSFEIGYRLLNPPNSVCVDASFWQWTSRPSKNSSILLLGKCTKQPVFEPRLLSKSTVCFIPASSLYFEGPFLVDYYKSISGIKFILARGC